MLQRHTRVWRSVVQTIGASATVLALSLVTAASYATVVSTDGLPYFSDGNSQTPPVGSSALTQQTLVTSNGGAIDSVPSYPGAGSAADYPNFDGAANGARAVVAMTNTTSIDAMNPGTKGFTFGADILSDSISVGTTYDNGNNIFQRGLFGDKAQYKLQIDHGFAMCRVKGDLGNISVTSTHLMPINAWYRIRCTRKVLATSDRLLLDVTPINADGTLGAVIRTTSTATKIGHLTYPLATPLSIGGKLTNATTIHSASDQFNGLIDNPVLDIN